MASRSGGNWAVQVDPEDVQWHGPQGVNAVPVEFVPTEFFEVPVDRYMRRKVTFPALEKHLTDELEWARQGLFSQIESNQIKIQYANGTMRPVEEDRALQHLQRQDNAPFMYRVSNNQIAHNSAAAAFLLRIKVDDREVTTAHMNEQENDPGAGFGILVDTGSHTPSPLTLYLAYCQEFLDATGNDLSLEEDGDSGHVLWRRLTPVTALLVAFMLQQPETRRVVANILANHANIYYQIPLDLARNIRQRWADQQNKPSVQNILVEVDTVPRNAKVHAILASVQAFRFKFNRTDMSVSESDTQDQPAPVVEATDADDDDVE